MSDRVTQTNREIIQQLFSGLNYKQIAGNLAIKQRTIKARIRVMKDQLGCTTRDQLVAKYMLEYAGNMGANS